MTPSRSDHAGAPANRSSRRARWRRLVVVVAAAASLLLAGCGDADGDARPAVPGDVDAAGSTAGAGTDVDASDAGDAAVASTAAGSTDAVSTDVVDLRLEEGPADDPATFSERLEASGYLDQASEPELEVLAQDECAGLAAVVTDQYQLLLDDLGDAGRDDVAAIDLAFASPAVNGQLISRRADELGCDADRLGAAVCPGIAGLRSRGDVGDDVVATLAAGCDGSS